MLDIKLIRAEPDVVRAALARRGQAEKIDQVLAADEQRRKAIAAVEQLKADRNSASDQIARIKMEKGDASDLIASMKQVSDRIKQMDDELRLLEQELNQALAELPNLPHQTVPDGLDEANNVIIDAWGLKPEFEIPPRPHFDIVTDLGMVDFERGAKIAGSGFPLYLGAGAKLQRALIGFMMDLHSSRHGYTEVIPPFVTRSDVMYDSGKLPKFADDMYHVTIDDLWLNPTAEAPVTGIHIDEILPPGSLPLKYVAYCASFRREAGSAGKDTRGLIRLHQFDKVELFQFTEPGRSYEALEEMLAHARAVVMALELPHRVLNCCAGEIGQAATKMYDIELWAPGLGKWLEVSSVSNCTDYQARRGNIRYRTEAQGKPEFVHTLNGSGLALPRTVIAIIENNQQPDGTIAVPPALRPYLGGLELIS